MAFGPCTRLLGVEHQGELNTWMGVWLLAWELCVTFEGGDTDRFWRTLVLLLRTFNQTMWYSLIPRWARGTPCCDKDVPGFCKPTLSCAKQISVSAGPSSSLILLCLLEFLSNPRSHCVWAGYGCLCSCTLISFFFFSSCLDNDNVVMPVAEQEPAGLKMFARLEMDVRHQTNASEIWPQP